MLSDDRRSNGWAETDRHRSHAGKAIALLVVALLFVVFGGSLWLGKIAGAELPEPLEALFARIDGFSGFEDDPAVSEAFPQSFDEELEPTEGLQDHPLNLVGLVYPGKSMAVTGPFDGHIIALDHADLGSFIRKGDLIATVDSVKMRREIKQASMSAREAEVEYQKLLNWKNDSSVLQAKRQVETAKRGLADAKRLTARTKALLDEGIIAASEYELQVETKTSAENNLASAIDSYDSALEQGNADRVRFARQRYELAKDEYDSLQDSLAKKEIRAPQDGILLPGTSVDDQTSSTGLTIGQAVSQSSAMIIVGDIKTIQVKTTVSEFDVDRLLLGQKARLTSPVFAGKEVTGEISAISKYTANFQDMSMMSSGFGPQAARFEVSIMVPAADLGIDANLRIGMSVDIEIDTGSEPPAITDQQTSQVKGSDGDHRTQ